MLLLAGHAFAEAQIKAEVDKKVMSSDELLSYKITIDAQGLKLPAPIIPKFEGFNVVSTAQSNSISFSAGNMSNVISYVYVLAPVKTGKIKIEPAQAKIGEKNFSTESFEIEVRQGKAPLIKPTPKKNQAPVSPKGATPKEEQYTL